MGEGRPRAQVSVRLLALPKPLPPAGGGAKNGSALRAATGTAAAGATLAAATATAAATTGRTATAAARRGWRPCGARVRRTRVMRGARTRRIARTVDARRGVGTDRLHAAAT